MSQIYKPFCLQVSKLLILESFLHSKVLLHFPGCLVVTDLVPLLINFKMSACLEEFVKCSVNTWVLRFPASSLNFYELFCMCLYTHLTFVTSLPLMLCHSGFFTWVLTQNCHVILSCLGCSVWNMNWIFKSECVPHFVVFWTLDYLMFHIFTHKVLIEKDCRMTDFLE